MHQLTWRLDTSEQVIGQVSEALDAQPPSIDTPNVNDVWDVLLAYGENRGDGLGLPAGRWPGEDIPTIHLCIATPGFAPDFFQFSGLYYVSAAFRAAAERAGARVQYLPVDMTGSATAAHAKDYKLLNVLDGAKAEEPEAEGPLAVHLVQRRFLVCSSGFAMALLHADLVGVEIYDPATMTPGRPTPAQA